MDPDKVNVVMSWPPSRSVWGLCSFLGLVGYYRLFIKDFGAIAAPLTQLLRKDSFLWSEAAVAAFASLKQALLVAPILQLPYLEQLFVVDCDTFGSCFGAVVHQGTGAIAFFSRPFLPCHMKLAPYERELIGLEQAVRHWRPYLWGRCFVVRTDHYALQFLLHQRLSTLPQHQWVSKLFGYDFAVKFWPTRLNIAMDALSRQDETDDRLNAMSGPGIDLFTALCCEFNDNADLRVLQDSVVTERGAP